MTSEEIIGLVAGMEGAVAVTADAASGAPEVAWGDTFFFYDPDDVPADRTFPFVTVVIKDYPGFDTASDLDRPGVFRLNAGVGRDRFEALVGYAPAAHAEHQAGFDYTALDVVLPHPAYAAQSWVCVLNPSPEHARLLLDEAYARARGRAERTH